MTGPGYWMNETSGRLAPAIEAYLNGAPMTREQITAMRAYLRQWIWAPNWVGSKVRFLRRSVDDLQSREAISSWLMIAGEIGIDPL